MYNKNKNELVRVDNILILIAIGLMICNILVRDYRYSFPIIYLLVMSMAINVYLNNKVNVIRDAAMVFVITATLVYSYLA